MTTSPAPFGMLLLTGGEGRRFGAPKHLQPHPTGGSWAGQLVRVFEAVHPGAPVQVLGAPVPERPELPAVEDPRLGPARALVAWAGAPLPCALRWWVVACDLVSWTPESLAAWSRRAVEADPEGRSWVLAEHEGRTQYLGGFLASVLLPRVAASDATSLRALCASLPCRILPVEGPEWLDVDRPEDLPTGLPSNGDPARSGPRPRG